MVYQTNRYIRSNYRKTGGYIDYGYIGIAHGKVTISTANGIYYTMITASLAGGGCGESVSVGAVWAQRLAGVASFSGSIGGGGISVGSPASNMQWVGAWASASVWGINVMEVSGSGSLLGTAEDTTMVLQYVLFVVSR
jgi:hypothetical protein